MTWLKLWMIGFRDLGRNRRRSGLTALAVALGLALLIFLDGYLVGIVGGSLENSIHLETGHVQLRADSYQKEKMSLLWDDLVDNADEWKQKISQMSEVESVTPVLWGSTILSTMHESSGMQLVGIEPEASFFQPIRDGMVEGNFLSANARNEVIIGKRLAEDLGIGVGQKIGLAVGSPDGQSSEGLFTVAGIYDTRTPAYDEKMLFMPLSQAQNFTDTTDRASALIIMLHNKEKAESVVKNLSQSGVSALTWQEMNSMMMELMDMSMSYYIVIDGIIMLIVAVLIANTLLMVAFERTREMGILAALGMKRWQIVLMFLLESATIALIGIVLGILLGAAINITLSHVGIFIGDVAVSAGNMTSLGSTVYPQFVLINSIGLSFWLMLITLAASLYPAWFAARKEPVEALHAV